ncbi:hypothetical protein GCM10007916_32910 [Psychromonas marina]|uniref:Prepilin-type N-terminal cleavage/methylation domain-containing protein n=1 Tax=Psychromonas marina TaxID=88364 RepID=A0ABQ6E5D3_9GAMM|nr:prepilin-type N-terminal cleavage/methylation domain-containing protein [Psychromonas marina]GLS92221.1 hypothetical protein GCM10007916_32910 [Psychromonas marina]
MLTRKPCRNLGNSGGFSLIELLIALLLGALLLVMVIGLYVTGVSTGATSLQYSRLRTDLQSIMAMLETDIRRAGYSGGAESYLVGANNNKTIDINDNKNCIVYYYNHNHSETVESSNKMAFSLNKGVIKFKSGVESVANNVCSQVNGWTDISDVSFVTISDLTFSETVISSATATVRSVKIKLAGELVSNSHYNHVITTRVQIRNIEFPY